MMAKVPHLFEGGSNFTKHALVGLVDDAVLPPPPPYGATVVPYHDASSPPRPASIAAVAAGAPLSLSHRNDGAEPSSPRPDNITDCDDFINQVTPSTSAGKGSLDSSRSSLGSSTSSSCQGNSGTNIRTIIQGESWPIRLPTLHTATAGEDLSQEVDYSKTTKTAPSPRLTWRVSSNSGLGKLAEPVNASQAPDHEAAAHQDEQASSKPPPYDQVNAAWTATDKTLTKAQGDDHEDDRKVVSTSFTKAEAYAKQPAATAADDHQATGTQADKYGFHAESKNHETDAFLKSLHDGGFDSSSSQVYDNETASLDSRLWLREHGLLDSDDENQTNRFVFLPTSEQLGGCLFRASGYTTNFVFHNGAAGWQEVLQVAAEIRFWVRQLEDVGQGDYAAVAGRIRAMVRQGQRTLLVPRGAHQHTIFLLQANGTIEDTFPNDEPTPGIRCPNCQGRWCFANDNGKKYMKGFMQDVGACVKCAPIVEVHRQVDAFNGRGHKWPGIFKLAHLAQEKTEYLKSPTEVKKQLEVDVLLKMLNLGGLVVRQWPHQDSKMVHGDGIQFYAVTDPYTVSEKVRKLLAEHSGKQPAPVVNDNGKLPAKKARGGGGGTNK